MYYFTDGVPGNSAWQKIIHRSTGRVIAIKTISCGRTIQQATTAKNKNRLVGAAIKRKPLDGRVPCPQDIPPTPLAVTDNPFKR